MRSLAWLRSQPLRSDVALMIVCFALLRMFAALSVGARTYPDTNSYLTLDFAGGAPRLWTIPLVYELISSDTLRVAAQVLIGIVAWGVLAVAIATVPRHAALARIGAAAVLILGLTVQVTQWDVTLLSESIGNSLAVLVIGALLLVVQRQTTPAYGLLLAAVTLWMFARHVNVIVVLIVLPFALLVLLWKAERPRAFIVAWLLVVICVWGGWTLSREGEVWILNSYGVLTQRMLGDPDAEKHYTDRGLVITRDMRIDQQKYRIGASPGYRDPATREWFKERWRGAYASWLLTHPLGSIRKPLNDVSALLAVNVEYSQPRPVLPSPLQDAAFGRSGGDIPFWFLATAALWFAAWWRHRGVRALDIAGAAIVAVGCAWYFIVWHLATEELARLTVPVALTLRVGLLVLALLALDRLLLGRRARAVSAPAQTTPA